MHELSLKSQAAGAALASFGGPACAAETTGTLDGVDGQGSAPQGGGRTSAACGVIGG